MKNKDYNTKRKKRVKLFFIRLFINFVILYKNWIKQLV